MAPNNRILGGICSFISVISAPHTITGLYAGRKTLSRALRSRFLELHVPEPPSDELAHVLHRRSCVPLSHARKLVEAMKQLQRARVASNAFAGRYAAVTPRDLFKYVA